MDLGFQRIWYSIVFLSILIVFVIVGIYFLTLNMGVFCVELETDQKGKTRTTQTSIIHHRLLSCKGLTQRVASLSYIFPFFD